MRRRRRKHRRCLLKSSRYEYCTEAHKHENLLGSAVALSLVEITGSLTFLSFYLPKFRILEGGSLGVVSSQPAEHSAGQRGSRDSGMFPSCVAEY